MYISINADFFGIINSCFSMFEQYKESYDINLYRNTANIANNFDFFFLKSLWNDTNQTTTLSVASTIEYFSNHLLLNITNIHLPNQINITILQPKDTPLEELTCINVFGYVFSVCKLNDSQFAVGCDYPNDIFIVDFNTFEILRTLKHHTERVWKLYVHKNSGLLLSLSFDYSICVWEYSSGKWIKELRERNGCLRDVVEWNNGDIVTVSEWGIIKYWEMREYQCYRTIENGSALYAVILKDNKWITGGSDGIKYFKQDARSMDDYINHDNCDFKCVWSLWLVNCLWLAGCNDGSIWIYDANWFELQGELKGHTSYVNSLIVLRNGWVASGGGDSVLKIWDWDTKETKETIKLGGYIYTGWCEWDVNSVICGSYNDKAIRLFVRK